MTDVEIEGVFVDSNGVEPSFTKWSTNEPTNGGAQPSWFGGEDYATMNKGNVWNDIANRNVAVICQLLCNSGNKNK